MSVVTLDLRQRAEELARALLRRAQEDKLGPWTGDEFVRQQTEINYSFALQVQRETVQACADLARRYGYEVMPDQLTDSVNKVADEILSLLPVGEATKEGGGK